MILTNRMLVRIIQVEGVAAFKLECLLENATVVNTLISTEPKQALTHRNCEINKGVLFQATRCVVIVMHYRKCIKN